MVAGRITTGLCEPRVSSLTLSASQALSCAVEIVPLPNRSALPLRPDAGKPSISALVNAPVAPGVVLLRHLPAGRGGKRHHPVLRARQIIDHRIDVAAPRAIAAPA